MRLYYTGASPDNLRKAREHAPSHTHGYGWTPQKMTPHDGPYFLDNGAYAHKFDGELWVSTLDEALTEMPTEPDFVVLPDVPGEARATIEKHRRWLYDEPLPLGSGEIMRYWVIQPGMPIADQMDEIEGCQGVFVGGSKRWLRAHGDEIVREARKRDLRTHVGNPSGKDGLVWAYRTGFDSADTTTVFQNGYWHYLDRLEAATEGTGTSDPTDASQLELDDEQLIADGGIPPRPDPDAIRERNWTCPGCDVNYDGRPEHTTEDPLRCFCSDECFEQVVGETPAKTSTGTKQSEEQRS